MGSAQLTGKQAELCALVIDTTWSSCAQGQSTDFPPESFGSLQVWYEIRGIDVNVDFVGVYEGHKTLCCAK